MLKTLGLPIVVANATDPLPLDRPFDRILADVPCSGTGTLARNPEIKWRLQPEDLPDLAARQRAILRQGLKMLAPGGRLVYSTCSLEKEENEDIVQASGAKILEVMTRIPGEDSGDGFFAAVLAV
jgi:16S rRNA (cytosine967-C5)-methyltransferase